MVGKPGRSGGKREGAGAKPGTSGGVRPGAGRPTQQFTVRVGEQLLLQRDRAMQELYRVSAMDRSHLWLERLVDGQVVETIRFLR